MVRRVINLNGGYLPRAPPPPSLSEAPPSSDSTGTSRAASVRIHDINHSGVQNIFMSIE